MLQFFIHYGIHFLAPGIVAYIFFNSNWKKAWLLMLATMLIDLDHLLATPIFNPDRCSINTHVLHQTYLLPLYCLLFIPKKTRSIAAGIILHFVADGIDCLFM